MMIVGIDIGGSTTDAVTVDNGDYHVVTIEANDPVAAAAGALGKLVEEHGIKLDQVACVAATGAGSRALSHPAAPKCLWTGCKTFDEGNPGRSKNPRALARGVSRWSGQSRG